MTASTITDDIVNALDQLLAKSNSIGMSEGHPLHSAYQTQYAVQELEEDRAAFLEMLRHAAQESEKDAAYPAIWLRQDGGWVTVSIEVGADKERRWVEVIRDFSGGGMSRIAEPLGIQARIDAAMAPK